MNTNLTLAVVKRLRLENKPNALDGKGNLLFEPNHEKTAYILFDSSQDAPPGFGIKVDKKKTWIVQRRVRGKVIKFTVGNCADYSLDQARELAAELTRAMIASGENPNRTARILSASEITLGKALNDYRRHMETRTQRPAAAETLRVVDRVIRRFESYGWTKRKVREIATDEIMTKFLDGRNYPTANEQAFRWASAAVRWVIDNEILAAAAAKRETTLGANPFTILYLNSMFRTRAQIERERDDGMKRNPLGPSTTLGPFLEAAWSKRRTNNNVTGCDYLILMLLWGCRKSEHAPCVWGELLSEEERKKTSHVWLEDSGTYGPYVFFYWTKNGRNMRLPLGGMARTLLERRQISAAEEAAERGFKQSSRRWVFPAKSKFSKTGHYSDAKDLLDRVREEAGIERLTRHDLRRSFGAVMTTLDVPRGVEKRFLNHADSDVTDTYTKAEWSLIKDWIEKIEQYILATAPNIYNSLKPSDWPPLAAPDPHVCKPPKPRTGRPRKNTVLQTECASTPAVQLA